MASSSDNGKCKWMVTGSYISPGHGLLGFNVWSKKETIEEVQAEMDKDADFYKDYKYNIWERKYSSVYR